VTKDEARDLVGMLVATWPRPPVEKATVHAYAFALADLDHEAVKAAVLSLMQTSRFLPTIAEIRERSVKQRVNLPGPEEAWGIVRRAVGTVGSYRLPEFDCDEIQAAVRAIGWKEICLGENEAATRARFIDAMKGETARRMQAEATGRYVPPDRQLPANTVPHSGRENPAVRVMTGFETERPKSPELKAAAADGDVVDIAPWLASRFPSTREP
jgi:hypothetical protein